MPNKVIENGRVPRELGKDKRLRLSPLLREEIRQNEERLSLRKLAAKYGVSKRLIQFIINPEKHAENLKRREERGGSTVYYDPEKHREAMQRHREHKAELLTKGELIV